MTTTSEPMSAEARYRILNHAANIIDRARRSAPDDKLGHLGTLTYFGYEGLRDQVADLLIAIDVLRAARDAARASVERLTQDKKDFWQALQDALAEVEAQMDLKEAAEARIAELELTAAKVK